MISGSGRPVTDHFPGGPGGYRLDAPELAVRVVDQGVIGEGGEEALEVKRVDGLDVPGQDSGESGLGHAAFPPDGVGPPDGAGWLASAAVTVR
jgi:hypothetical protein